MAAAAPEYFKLCTTCKKPLGFGVEYYRCSVSTCNHKKLGMFFCSVGCWDAHVPMMRHRDAWAEKVRAPSREQYLEELAKEAEQERVKGEESEERTMSEDNEARRRVVGLTSNDDVPREVLIVVSKLKAYVRARSGMNTSDGVVDVLSSHVRKLCDRAIQHAATEGRKTVMDRDFEAILKD